MQSKVTPLRYLGTVIRLSLAGLRTTALSERRGYTRAQAECGASRAANWLAWVPASLHGKATPWLYPGTGTRPSSVAGFIPVPAPKQRGCSRARGGSELGRASCRETVQ